MTNACTRLQINCTRKLILVNVSSHLLLISTSFKMSWTDEKVAPYFWVFQWCFNPVHSVITIRHISYRLWANCEISPVCWHTGCQQDSHTQGNAFPYLACKCKTIIWKSQCLYTKRNYGLDNWCVVSECRITSELYSIYLVLAAYIPFWMHAGTHILPSTEQIS